MPQPPRLDYSNRDLQNRSFKNQDLTGADFSGSDLQGCNFSGSTLTGANFQRVRIGQSRKQFITLLAVILAIPGYVGCFAAILGIVLLLVLVASAGAKAVTLLGVILVLIVNAVAALIDVESAFANAMTFAVNSSLAVIFALAAPFAFAKGEIVEGSGLLIFSICLITLAISSFCRSVNAIRNTSGGMFEAVDLTGANFGHASIQNADFSNSAIDFVDWTDVSFAQCTFPNRFAHCQIRQLCASRDGCGQDYSHVNLKRLHLAGVVLAGANLAKANLNDSNLQGANLERANLQSTQALGTDFSHAILTGACIQNWGINADTCFTDVRCDYIYLEPDQQARQPASGSFAPGDFAKLVNQFSKTLDFLFRNGIEAQAFDVALKGLLTEYEDAGLSLKAVVDVGDGDRLVKLNVANPTADKAPMHAQFMHDYTTMQKQLEAARDAAQALQQDLAHTKGQLTVYREQSVFLQGFVYHQTDRFSRPSFNAPNSQFTGDLMADNDNKIQFGNVQGDVSGIAGGDISGVAGKDITGAAGGDISGTLNLTIGQLEATKDPEALKLADLLKQLKSAIEQPDAGLDKKDQEKALKHVDAIAKLGSDRTNADLLERAGDALDALPTIVKRGNGLLEFSEKYLPTITAGIKTVLAAWGIAL